MLIELMIMIARDLTRKLKRCASWLENLSPFREPNRTLANTSQLFMRLVVKNTSSTLENADRCFFFDFGNDFKEPLWHYRGNKTGSKIPNVSGNYEVGGKASPATYRTESSKSSHSKSNAR